MGVKLSAVNGFNISQSRRIVEFAFGDFFLKGEKNYEKTRYDFYLVDKVIQHKNGEKKILLLSDECIDVEYFKKYWNEKDQEVGVLRKEGYWNIIILDQKY